MKIFLTGASSLPGYRVALEAVNKGYEVLAISKKNPIPLENRNLKKIKLDLRFKSSYEKKLREEKPEVIVHMAALGDVDLCEKNKNQALEVNYKVIKDILNITKNFSPFVVFLSTDYIFDGERGGYKEYEPPYPVNYYGLTKLIGELATECLSDNYAVVRASSLYGFGPGRKNFAKFLVEKLSKNEPVNAIVDQYTTPTHATLLAKSILDIIEKEANDIFHITGEKMSRYEFALKNAEVFNFDKELVKKSQMSEMSWFAKRPKDTSLNSEDTRKKLNFDFYSNKVAFKQLKDEYESEDFG